MRPPIEPRPVSLGGHALNPTGLADDKKTKGHSRCSLCRATSAKPSFCTTRCKGSAAARWAKAAKDMADNDAAGGGGHTRMISGHVFWCSTCGSYSDRRVSGLTVKCTGPHIGPWHGGGKLGQLKALRKNIHPKHGTTLPPPIPEALIPLDSAATAACSDVATASLRASRCSAKDKAAARRNYTLSHRHPHR